MRLFPCGAEVCWRWHNERNSHGKWPLAAAHINCKVLIENGADKCQKQCACWLARTMRAALHLGLRAGVGVCENGMWERPRALHDSQLCAGRRSWSMNGRMYSGAVLLINTRQPATRPPGRRFDKTNSFVLAAGPIKIQLRCFPHSGKAVLAHPKSSQSYNFYCPPDALLTQRFSPSIVTPYLANI